MHFLNFLKLFIVFCFFVNTAYTENCDLDDIKRMVGVTGELSLYPSGFVNDGDKRTLKCKRPSGVYQPENIVESSIVAYCKNGVFNFQGKSCAEACDVSNALQLNFGIDFKNTKLTDGSKISSSKLVPLNSKIKIQCLENYRVQDSNQNYYIYECGKPNDIKKCIPNPVVIDVKPPKSNTSDNFKPMLKCNVNDIVAPNGKRITEVNTFSDLNTEVEIACEGGYSVYGGQEPNKISQKYKIKCDPQGTGKWIGLKACTKRCDVTALVKATTNTLISSVDLLDENNKYLGFVKDKNSSNSTTIYTETNSTVRVKCNADYEVRSLNKPYYDTSCLDGSNFDVGSNVPKCERIIKPCNNKDITVTGILQQPSLATSVTNVGQRVAFKCQGDAIQEGNYFKYGNNENKGANGIPVCEYDSSNPNQSKWSHTTFKCYDGCISETNETMLIKTNSTLVKKKNKIVPFALVIKNLVRFTWKGGTALQNCTDGKCNVNYLMGWSGTGQAGTQFIRPGIPLEYQYANPNLTDLMRYFNYADKAVVHDFSPLTKFPTSNYRLELIYNNKNEISKVIYLNDASITQGDINITNDVYDIGMSAISIAEAFSCQQQQTDINYSVASTIEVKLAEYSKIFNSIGRRVALTELLPGRDVISKTGGNIETDNDSFDCSGDVFDKTGGAGTACFQSLKSKYGISANYQLGTDYEISSQTYNKPINRDDLYSELKTKMQSGKSLPGCNGILLNMGSTGGRTCSGGNMNERTLMLLSKESINK